MLTVFPATTTLVERAAPALLGTETVAVPLTEPDPLTLAHETDDEVQAQLGDVVTVTLCELAAAVKLRDAADNV